MTKPCRAAFIIDVCKKHRFWCFSFVTLFNLQGTRPSASAAERTLSYHVVRLLSSTFSTFSKFFRRLPRLSAALSDSPSSISELPEFVKSFFYFVLKFQGAFLSAYRRSQIAYQVYQSFQSLSSTFFTSLKSFLLSLWLDRRVSDSLLTIPDLSPFVNTFFQLFASFLFSSPQHTSQLLPLSSFLFIPLCHWA